MRTSFTRNAATVVGLLLSAILPNTYAFSQKHLLPRLESNKQNTVRESWLPLHPDKHNNMEDEGSPGSTDEETVGQMRGGLVFLKTADLHSIVHFYTERVGMNIWLKQPNITILVHGNMLLGFHQIDDSQEQQTPETTGMYTFVYPSKKEVDAMHTHLLDVADAPPRVNDRYRIYQFFARDPEGRALEFQAFLHPLTIVTSQV